MKLQTPFIAILMASLFYLGITGFFGSIGDSYVNAGYIDDTTGLLISNGTQTLEGTLDNIDETKEQTIELQNTFEDFQGNILDVWVFGQLFYQTANLLYTSIAGLGTTANEITQFLGIDPIIGTTLFILVILSFIVTVILVLAGRVVG